MAVSRHDATLFTCGNSYTTSVDAALHIYFEDPAEAGVPGSAVKTYPCDPIAVDGMINLDFDEEGRVIGIEILDARSKLPPYLLGTAERLDS